MRYVALVQFLLTFTFAFESFLEDDSHFHQYCRYLTCSNFTSNDLFVLISKSNKFSDNILEFKNATIPELPKKFFAIVPNLKHLYASNNNIEYFGHSTFESAGNLRTLNLSGNKLKFILKRTFEGAENLQDLYLNDNEIVELSSDAFIGLEQLVYITLENNQILDIKWGLFDPLPNLGWVHFARNKVKSLYDEMFRNNTKLQFIDFSENNIFEVGRNTFSNIQSISELNLSKNHLSDLTVNLRKVYSLYADNNLILNKFEVSNGSVVKLYLQNNQIEKMFLSRPADLENLILTNNSMSDLKSLYFAFNLKKLYLSANRFREIHQDDFRNMIKLESLYLLSNKLKRINKNSFRNQKALRYLDISYNYLFELDIKVLDPLKNLKYFNLHGNFWKCSSLEAIIQELNRRNIEYKPDELVNVRWDIFDSIGNIYCSKNLFQIEDGTNIEDDLDELQRHLKIILGLQHEKLKNFETSLKDLKESFLDIKSKESENIN